MFNSLYKANNQKDNLYHNLASIDVNIIDTTQKASETNREKRCGRQRNTQ